MTTAPNFSVVSPVYACEGCLEELCDRLRETFGRMRATYEIIFVCDASPDSSWRRIKEIAARDERVIGLRLARNVGQHAAISAGLQHVQGKWAVVMDCDLQDVPEEIPALYAKAGNGFDIVFAQRVERQDTFFKRFSSRAFYRVLGYLTGTRYDASTANFGIFSFRAIQAVNALPERGRFFPLMVRWAGYPTAVLPVQHARRATGTTTYSFAKLLRLAVEIVLSYSDKPLRLVAKTGVLFSLAALALVCWSVYRFLHGDVAVAGYTSIMASVWLLGGIAIFCIGIVGLYIGRMFNDIKQRPYYTLVESVNLPLGSNTNQETFPC